MHVRRAKSRANRIEELQLSVTERRVGRLVGKDLEILIEEPVTGERLYIGRSYAQAPEVDGNVVVHGNEIAAGSLVRCKVFRRNGIDLEAAPIADDMG